MLPEPIKKFAEIFSTLPSIGNRQAIRIAFKLINGGKAKIDELAKTISDLRYLKTCSRCFFVHMERDNLCSICSNPNRQQNVIAIIEKETDLISLERTKKFKGRYLVLGELSKTGILDTVQKLRLNHLKDLIKKEFDSAKAEEIIIAVNPTTYGDINASIITKELAPFTKKISRLGRGIPTGGEIEFADEETLASSIDSRS